MMLINFLNKQYFLFCPIERTIITNRPYNMDVTVGESIVLPCQVSKDPSIEVVFSWLFNGDLIDFSRRMTHFERVGGVSFADSCS